MSRLTLVLAVIAAAIVPAASATESTIYPGVGIGKVRLGMTKAQVEHVLGRDSLVNARERAYTELAWDFASWTVGFQRGRTVQISTSLRSQRTKQRIGPGSTWRAVVRAYPGGRCGWNARPNLSSPRAMWPEYLVGHVGGSQTLYVFTPNARYYGKPTPPIVVSYVVVRTRFRALPEFAQNWSLRCVGDWRHAERPELKNVQNG